MSKLELIGRFAAWLDSRDMDEISYHIGRERFDVMWTDKKE